MNVLMIGFDSVSQLEMQRSLPLTLKYMEHSIGAVRLRHYNIIGDGTPQALTPILTGLTEAELPEARKTKKNSVKVKNITEYYLYNNTPDK